MQEQLPYNLKEHLNSRKLKIALDVNTQIRSKLADILRSEGFVEIPPVIFSTVTDPLNHPVYDPSFTYEGTRYALTKSMIFHKQMIVQSIPKIFTFSPNVRLEEGDKATSGRHLLEFTQLDLEVLGATRDDVMRIGERLVRETIGHVKTTMAGELLELGRELRIPVAPFKRYKFLEAKKEFGANFEQILSDREKEPFWIVDIPLKQREFYDREKDDEKGILMDMDLMYPEGFNEALSGGEREFEIERIKARILSKDQTFEQFKWFLQFAETGMKGSAGFGIGVERFVRFLCGFKRIEDVHPFPKIPGQFSI